MRKESISRYRNPFNPDHYIDQVFSAGQQTAGLPGEPFRLDRDARKRAIDDSRTYEWALAQTGGRVPRTLQVYEPEWEATLDNVTLPADTIKTTAQLAVSLYEKLLLRATDQTQLDLDERIRAIKEENSTLDEEVDFIETVRKLAPKILDYKEGRLVHPSAVLSRSGLIALGILSLPRTAFKDKSPRTKAREILREHDPYAWRLYKHHSALFNGEVPAASTSSLPSGEYL